MKQLVKEIVEQLDKRIRGNKTNLARLEGIEDPRVIKAVCETFRGKQDLQFIGKLSLEKYNDFLKCAGTNGLAEWMPALNYLKSNGYVDFGGAITNWRNKAADYPKGNGKVLVLLIGTEAVLDKGGLEDFFHISPAELVKSLTPFHYSKWFEELYKDNGLPDDRPNAMDGLFYSLYKDRVIDLCQLSDYIDWLSKENFDSEDQLIRYILENFHSKWGFPSILFPERVPRANQLKKRNYSSGAVISDSYSFFKRSEDFISGHPLKEVDKKLKQYEAELAEGGQTAAEQFICGYVTFPSYSDFSTAILEYLSGKHVDELRKQMLQIDYGMLDRILHKKIKREKRERIAPISVSGTPIEAYTKMISGIIRETLENDEKMPEKVLIKVTKIELSNCSKSDDKDKKSGEEEETSESLTNAFADICRGLDGILEFLNDGVGCVDSMNLVLSYEDERDPFSLENFRANLPNVHALEKWGNPCRISFTLTIPGSKEIKRNYRWLFSPFAAWKNCFALLTDFAERNKDAEYLLPPILYCEEMEELVYSSNEEEFYSRLISAVMKGIDDSQFREQLNSFRNTEIEGYYAHFMDKYRSWASNFCSCGYYRTLDQTQEVCECFKKLMISIEKHYDGLNGRQKQSIYALLDLLLITSNRDLLASGEIRRVLVPSHHPLMLEKMDAQSVYMRLGLNEVLKMLQRGGGQMKQTEVDARIAQYSQLSEITQGPDILPSKEGKFLSCVKVWSYCALYYDQKDSEETLLPNDMTQDLVQNEESELDMTISPEARIIEHHVNDYIKTFPARRDGLNLCFIDPKDLQPIVAAVRAVAKGIENENTTAVINLCIIDLERKKNSVGYLRQWLDRYFSEEGKVEIKTYLKFVTPSGGFQSAAWSDLLKGQDICFIYHVLETNDVTFARTDVNVGAKEIEETRFPLTFEPEAISQKHGSKRRICISQTQFEATDQYSQTIQKVGRTDTRDAKYRVMCKLEMSPLRQGIIDKAHEDGYCRWVVCIDKAIDRKLLEGKKIIGFTTGAGQYGEYNVTVSAQEAILDDIKKILERRLQERFGGWSFKRLQEAAEYCITVSRQMDGSRILKALNPRDYKIHDYLAYVLLVQELGLTTQADPSNYIIRQLINLDNHMHWFSGFENAHLSRPDFMLIEIEKNEDNLSKEQPLKIKIHLIECKMGQESDRIEHAKEQVIDGLKLLSAHWDPVNRSITKRYWRHQLYRTLIFSAINIESGKPEYETICDKIYRIMDGKFEISWFGDIYAYWLDRDGGDEQDFVDLEEECAGVKRIERFIHGQQFVQKMLLPESERTQPFEYERIEEATPQEEDEDSDFEEDGAKKKDGETIPQTGEIYRPYLAFLSDEAPHTRLESLAWVRTYFNISRRGTRLRYDNGNVIYETCLDRVITDFRKNGLILNSVLAKFAITPMGLEVLSMFDADPNCTFNQAVKRVNERSAACRENEEYGEEIEEQTKEQTEEQDVSFQTENGEADETLRDLPEPSAEKKLAKVRLLLGEDLRTKEPYYWEFGNKELGNRHLLINGNSGCGKTYCIQALLMEAALQGIASVVFDYTGGFTNSKLEPLFRETLQGQIEQRIVKALKVPMNPFEKQDYLFDEDIVIPETDVDIATRIANTFQTVYHFGDQQKSAIYSAVMEGIKEHGPLMSFGYMAVKLEEANTAPAKTVLSKIRPFIDMDPFIMDEQFSWQSIRDGGGQVYVIQLSGYDRDTQMLLTEFLLWDIWSFSVKNGDEAKPFIVVLDEAQNLSHAAESPSGKILTEGRKFGISGWYATQFMKPQLSDDEIQRLQQASQKLYFCPPDDGVMTVARNIDINLQRAKDWGERLKSLRKGECVTCGSMERNGKWVKYPPHVIKITSLEERLKHV